MLGIDNCYENILCLDILLYWKIYDIDIMYKSRVEIVSSLKGKVVLE